jgi:UDP-GlcNAc:undecaprenyl-phosphate GlcNAc-1-phosphate transferase
MNFQVLAFLLALALSFLLTPRVRKLATRLNVIAQPGGRRIHGRPVPLWGGLAIYAGFTVAVIAVSKLGSRWVPDLHLDTRMLGILIAGAIVATIGMIDDLKEMSAALQAMAIVAAAVVLMGFGVRIEFISSPFRDGMVWLSWLSVPVTVFWIFGLTKTIDLMDGLDGLAAGIGAIAAGCLAFIAYSSAQPAVALMAAALCGACIGFLRFNFNPAKIFMGTTGSQFIGFTLAALSIIGALKVAVAAAVALPVLVFGVPIFDAIFVVWKRWRGRRPLHRADHSHLHYRLMQRGFSHKQTVLLIYGICLALGITATTVYLLTR